MAKQQTGTTSPNSSLTGEALRKTILNVVQEYSTMGSGYFQTGSILREVLLRSGARSEGEQQAILTYWNDLFRSGLLAPGLNIENPTFPFLHLTTRGRETLKHISRDPANPDGYLASLASRVQLDDISRSYIEEAVRTYNAGCYKAAAVMVGGAAEAMLLRLRDKIVAKISIAGTAIPTGMNDWRIKTVRDSITTYLDSHKATMQKTLRETCDAYWTAFAEQIRRVRNDAGHPQSVDPVSEDSVHASLLIFPELAYLINDLEAWIGP